MSVVPSVTVVLPVHNGEATLGRALASLQAQSLRDWELVLVDDGSTDGSREIAAAAGRADARVRLLHRPHGGIVAALNAGLSLARAPLIARLDADDEAHPTRLAEQAALFALPDHAATGLVGCRVEFGGRRDAAAGYALHVDWLNSLVTPEDIARNRFVESPFAHPSVMFRRELVDRYGGYRDGDFPEDYELWLRWLDAGVRMTKVPRTLLTWHDPPRRLSRTDPRYAPEAFYGLKAAWIARELGRVLGGRAVWVWGAGRPTRRRAAHLEAHGVTIAGYIDVDARKVTPALGGRGAPVIRPEEIPPPDAVFVLGYVASRGARELIRESLRARGHVEGRDFLMCA